MSDKKNKPVKVPLNQAQLVEEWKVALKRLRPKNLRTIIKLSEKFKDRGMVF